jgi:colicin import membrane protein
MSFFNKYRGMIGTVLFHGMIIALMLYIHFSAPFPPPPEQGILVNFGTNDEGSGTIEPQRQPYTPQEEEEAASVPQSSSPPVQVAEKAETSPKELMTQDLEEAPAVTKQKSQKEEEDRKKREEAEKDRLEQLERERLAVAERQRIENERKRAEEAERQRIEAERKEQERQQQLRDQLKARMDNSFGGNADTGDNRGEGTQTRTGNQGQQSGSVDSNVRSDDPSKGSGISFSLDGRSVIGSLAKPEYQVNEYGTVVVEITVDKEGRVVSAVPGKKGSTTSDSRLLEAARKAALLARFNKVTDTGAAVYQKGSITYHFRLL